MALRCPCGSIFKRPTRLVRHLIAKCSDDRADHVLHHVAALATSKRTSVSVPFCPTCQFTPSSRSPFDEWAFLGHLCEAHSAHVYDQVSLNQLCSVAASCIDGPLPSKLIIFLTEALWRRSLVDIPVGQWILVLCEDPQHARQFSSTHSSDVIFMPILRASPSEKDELFFVCHLLSFVVANEVAWALSNGEAGLRKRQAAQIEIVSTEFDAVTSLSRIFNGQVDISCRHVTW